MKTKFASLQIFRAIAAILVVLFHVTSYSQEKFGHAFLSNIFSFGYTGVDFFFVLSGFIIFYIHSRDVGERQRTRLYLVKRLVRVYPIYWIITLVKVVVIVAIPTLAKDYEREIGTIVASFLLFPQSNLPIIGAAWTLSHEILFYLLFGIVIWLGRHRGAFLFGIWTIALLGFSVGRTADLKILPDHYIIQFLLNERNLEFIFGCLSAYLIMNYKLKYQTLMVLAGCVLFLSAGWYVSRGGQVPSYAILFGLPSLLLITGSASIEFHVQVKFPPLLVFLGDASYSIYLTHAMFINAFALIFQRVSWITQINPSLPLLVVAIGAVLGGSAVYQLVELPMLSLLRNRILHRNKVGFLTLSL